METKPPKESMISLKWSKAIYIKLSIELCTLDTEAKVYAKNVLAIEFAKMRLMSRFKIRILATCFLCLFGNSLTLLVNLN